MDFLQWKNLDDCNNHHSYNLRELTKLMFDKIFPHGVVQCVREATHFWPGREPSGLDHLYSNCSAKLSQPMLIDNGGSDHKMIMCNRYISKIVARQRVISKRS